MDKLLLWLWNRYRPQEGWLPLGMALSLVSCLAWALLTAAWVPEIWIVIPAGLGGALLGVALAKRPLRPLPAWTLIILYGLLITIVGLGKLWPSWAIWRAGWWATATFWRQNGALLFDRSAGWVRAAVSGGHSQETIIFAFGLGLGIWLLAAYMGWSIYRGQRPLYGLMLIGAALALNGYYSQVATYWVALFIGLAVLTAAIIHYTSREQTWQTNGMDYSDEIRLELTLYAAGMAIALLSLSLALPSFSITRFARLLAQQPAVQQIEDTWERIFGGVEEAQGGVGLGPSAPGGGGVMPRAYLLGNAPELSEAVVMAAILQEVVDGRYYLVQNTAGLHWRALSYEVYTGRGWTLSAEREERVAANQPISLPPLAAQRTFHQSINWVYDARAVRYTLGFPRAMDQEARLLWRGQEDLVRVSGSGRTYRATTQLAAASPDLLRATRAADAPPAILARYTALPDSVPETVHALAATISGHLDNPYDQARAIERYLRQYPYTLEAPPPPADEDDVVAYFLFVQQAGYCDYFASAMVVLARSLGLPARLAVGFAAQPPDENGVQTIYQVNAHAWAEVYFAGYGWVEFEPTAGFPTHEADNADAAALANLDATDQQDEAVAPLPIPAAPKKRPSLWRWWPLLLLAPLPGLALVIWWRWRRARPAAMAEILLVYGRLQQQAEQLGAPPLPQQTPFEFRDALLRYLAGLARQPRLRLLVQRIKPPVERLTAVFSAYQYGRPRAENGETAVAQAAWQALQRPLRRLRLASWLQALWKRIVKR
ncbi:MAG: transglutaminase domain-containing protein [Anaerolinea sp.]|nr:transglutaminase domain-containing protein [Anaerolinea sp.]